MVVQNSGAESVAERAAQLRVMMGLQCALIQDFLKATERIRNMTVENNALVSALEAQRAYGAMCERLGDAFNGEEFRRAIEKQLGFKVAASTLFRLMHDEPKATPRDKSLRILVAVRDLAPIFPYVPGKFSPRDKDSHPMAVNEREEAVYEAHHRTMNKLVGQRFEAMFDTTETVTAVALALSAKDAGYRTRMCANSALVFVSALSEGMEMPTSPKAIDAGIEVMRELERAGEPMNGGGVKSKVDRAAARLRSYAGFSQVKLGLCQGAAGAGAVREGFALTVAAVAAYPEASAEDALVENSVECLASMQLKEIFTVTQINQFQSELAGALSQAIRQAPGAREVARVQIEGVQKAAWARKVSPWVFSGLLPRAQPQPTKPGADGRAHRRAAMVGLALLAGLGLVMALGGAAKGWEKKGETAKVQISADTREGGGKFS
jgi:hypothetical protein